MRVAAAVGARTVGIFGPTLASPLRARADRASTCRACPDCPHRRPTAITEQVCWWEARCPLSPRGPACMADVAPGRVLDLVRGRVSVPASSGNQLALGSPGQK